VHRSGSGCFHRAEISLLLAAAVKADSCTSRPLAGEFDRALALLKMLDGGQRKVAIGSGRKSLTTDAKQRVSAMDDAGLPASPQQTLQSTE
jgi:hypothetical protein